VIVDLEREETISVSNPMTWHSHAPATIWEGKRVKGYPVLTMLRGRVIVEDGNILADGGGEYVRRTPIKGAALTDLAYPRTEPH
jgi:dihydropyrimidinase